VDNGFRKIDGGDRGGEPPAPPFARALPAFRTQRLRPANDNAAPLGLRLRRHALFAAASLILIALAWATLS
jgi:hypothetical protein